MGAPKGQIPWNRGIPRTEKEKRTISLALKEYWATHTPPHKGKKRPHSQEYKERRSKQYQGNGNPFYGRTHSDETKRRIAQTRIGHPGLTGEKNGMYGKHYNHTPEAKARLSEIAKKRWQDKEFKERTLQASMLGRKLKPNRVEKILINIIQKHHLPYKYTGNGSVIIGGLNPDFVNCNGDKLALEVFGDYWHGKIARKAMTLEGRTARFAEYGWLLVVFWESELEGQDAETLVLRRLSNQEAACPSPYQV